nr:Uma2 family endonuclease [Clostridium sp. AF32-12BH]
MDQPFLLLNVSLFSFHFYGRFYDMAPPSRIHQKLVSKLTSIIDQYISDHHGSCEVYPAPFAVNLDADDKDWVEPDISVICDPNKLTDRGCSGAPVIYSFTQDIPVGIYPGLTIKINDLL